MKVLRVLSRQMSAGVALAAALLVGLAGPVSADLSQAGSFSICQVYSGPGTFIFPTPPGRSGAYLDAVAGGAGGADGIVAGGPAGGGAGGSGAEYHHLMIPLVPGGSLTLTLGPPGSGGIFGGAVPTAGGTLAITGARRYIPTLAGGQPGSRSAGGGVGGIGGAGGTPGGAAAGTTSLFNIGDYKGGNGGGNGGGTATNPTGGGGASPFSGGSGPGLVAGGGGGAKSDYSDGGQGGQGTTTAATDGAAPVLGNNGDGGGGGGGGGGAGRNGGNGAPPFAEICS